MKTNAVHSFEPGEIPDTLRDLASRLLRLAGQAATGGNTTLESELSDCSRLMRGYATGIEYGVAVALTGETYDLLLALSLVEENLREVARLAYVWPALTDTPDAVREPLQRVSETFEDLLHNIELIRAGIPPMTTEETPSA